MARGNLVDIVSGIANIHILVVLAVILAALVLYSWDHLPIASTSFVIVAVLALFFAIFPFSYHGHPVDASVILHVFGNSALIAVVCLIVAGAGIIRTGALIPVGLFLSKTWSWHPALALLLTLVVVAVLSAFVNNTPIVVLLMPLLVANSLKTKTSASRVLMPVSFATLVGGMATTIGTSTNLLIVGIARNLGLPPLGMFAFTLPAVLVGSVAIGYLWLIAPHLIPDRKPPMEDVSPRVFRTHLSLQEASPVVGKTLADLRELLGVTQLVGILRGGSTALAMLPDLVLRARDILIVTAKPDRLKELEQTLGAAPHSDEEPIEHEPPVVVDDQQLCEVVVTPGSTLDGSTIRESFFRDRYNLFPIGLHRRRRGPLAPNADLDNQRLKAGDVLLVQGGRTIIANIRRSGALLMLNSTTDLPRSTKGTVALFVMALIIAPAVMGVVPIAVSSAVGVMAMVLTGCLEWRDVMRSVSADVIFMIAAGLAMSQALIVTGAAGILGQLLAGIVHGLPLVVVLALILFVVAFIANAASHVAAGLIGAPIAVYVAQNLHVAPEPFLLAVLFGANLGFATPMGYQTNVLVMNAGGYEFRDFLKIGLPLLVLMGGLYAWILPQLYA
ncbi:MAG: SLC13 family permease [Acidiferrobacter sp.]